MSTLSSQLIAAAGWAGAAATLCAYLLVSQRRVAADSATSQGLNLLGGALLGTSATVSQAWPSAAAGFLWTLVGLQAVLGGQRRTEGRLLQRRVAEQLRQRVNLLPGRGSGRPVTAEELSAIVAGAHTLPGRAGRTGTVPQEHGAAYGRHALALSASQPSSGTPTL